MRALFNSNGFLDAMASVNRANDLAAKPQASTPLRDMGFSVNTDLGREGMSLDSDAAGSPAPTASLSSLKGHLLIDPDAPKPLPSKIGRRSAPRLRLSLPGQLVAVERVHRCILLNLSRSGAQVAILDSLRVGEGAILRCGAIDTFAVVTRSEFGLNALEFDEPLSDAQVLDIRHLYENFEERERRTLMETARKWVTGDSDDDRSA
jgi:hypothetical protein